MSQYLNSVTTYDRINTYYQAEIKHYIISITIGLHCSIHRETYQGNYTLTEKIHQKSKLINQDNEENFETTRRDTETLTNWLSKWGTRGRRNCINRFLFS